MLGVRNNKQRPTGEGRSHNRCKQLCTLGCLSAVDGSGLSTVSYTKVDRIRGPANAARASIATCAVHPSSFAEHTGLSQRAADAEERRPANLRNCSNTQQARRPEQRVPSQRPKNRARTTASRPGLAA